MGRRGRCHRQRRLRRWSFSAVMKLLKFAFKSWLGFTCKGFLALLQKDYEKLEVKMTNDQKVKAEGDRFAGYKSMCQFGLGSLFWGSATGFLGQLKDKDDTAGKKPPTWINFCFAYSAFALVSMLLGLAASTFPKSSWLAPSLAGFGSLQALLLILGGFHVASLKYHSYDHECKYSLIGSSIILTVYWGLSIQDPRILHVLVKLIFWLASLIVYGVFTGACKACQFAKRHWKKVRTKKLLLKNTLMAENNTSDDYQLLAQTALTVSP